MSARNIFYVEHDNLVQYDTIDMNKCREEVLNLVKFGIKRFYPHNRLPVDDVAWDCFTTLYMNQFFDCYNPKEATQSTYLNTGVRNFLIDMERRECKKIHTLSSSYDAYDGDSLYNIVDDCVSDKMVQVSRYLDALEYLKDELKGLGFTHKWKKRGEIPDVGTVELDYYTVIFLYFIGYNFNEIAGFFNITSSRVSVIYKKGVNYLLELLDDVDFMQPSGDDTQSVGIKSLDSYDILCTKKPSKYMETPLDVLQPKMRQTFIDFCRSLLDGTKTVEVFKIYGFGRATGYRWKKYMSDYFGNKNKKEIRSVLDTWEAAL